MLKIEKVRKEPQVASRHLHVLAQPWPLEEWPLANSVGRTEKEPNRASLFSENTSSEKKVRKGDRSQYSKQAVKFK